MGRSPWNAAHSAARPSSACLRVVSERMRRSRASGSREASASAICGRMRGRIRRQGRLRFPPLVLARTSAEKSRGWAAHHSIATMPPSDMAKSPQFAGPSASQRCRTSSAIERAFAGLVRACSVPAPGRSRQCTRASGKAACSAGRNAPQCRCSRASPRKRSQASGFTRPLGEVFTRVTCYSCRRATSGSTFAARRAGRR